MRALTRWFDRLRAWCLWIGRCAPTVILVRHADVTSGSVDPPLNPAGQARALELRQVLADAGVAAIFVTQFQRTQQTAEPVASALAITPSVLDDSAAVIAALRALPSSSVALVVGHTNTLPEISAGLGGKPLPVIGATEFDRLFVQARGRTTHLRYGA